MMLSLIAVTILASSCSKVYSEYQHGYGQHEQQQLHSVPEFESYGKIEYPHFDIIDLGSYQEGHIPPKVVHLTKKIVIKEPKPYAVKVPHPVPYPVPHKVPYPVVHTELVKVPQPVPYPVTKTVQVPVEVPKPYPVPAHEYKESGGSDSGYGGNLNGGDQGNYAQFDHNSGGGQDFGNQDSYNQAPITYGVPHQEPGQPLGLADHNSGVGQDYGNQDSYNQAPITYGVPHQEPGQPLGLAEYQNQNQNYQVNYQVNHDGDFSGHQEEAQHDQSSNYAALLVPVKSQNSEEQNLQQHNEKSDS